MDVYCVISRSARLSAPTGKILLTEPLAYNNEQAHLMRVFLFEDDGSEADLSEAGVVASFMKSDNTTVEPINGTIDGNAAEVLLPPSCYVTTGKFKFTMNLTKTGGYSRTILWVEGIIERNTTDSIIDPGTPVSNISQAIGEANAAASAASSAASDALSAASAAQAVVSSSVRYDVVQTLTAAQKAQAIANIGIEIGTDSELMTYLGIT